MNDASREDSWEAVKGATDEELWEHFELPECRAELERRRRLKVVKFQVKINKG